MNNATQLALASFITQKLELDTFQETITRKDGHKMTTGSIFQGRRFSRAEEFLNCMDVGRSLMRWAQANKIGAWPTDYTTFSVNAWADCPAALLAFATNACGFTMEVQG